jgi:hypothetical protein
VGFEVDAVDKDADLGHPNGVGAAWVCPRLLLRIYCCGDNIERTKVCAARWQVGGLQGR